MWHTSSDHHDNCAYKSQPSSPRPAPPTGLELQGLRRDWSKWNPTWPRPDPAESHHGGHERRQDPSHSARHGAKSQTGVPAPRREGAEQRPLVEGSRRWEWQRPPAVPRLTWWRWGRAPPCRRRRCWRRRWPTASPAEPERSRLERSRVSTLATANSWPGGVRVCVCSKVWGEDFANVIAHNYKLSYWKCYSIVTT